MFVWLTASLVKKNAQMRYFTHVNTTLFAMDAAINWVAALLARFFSTLLCIFLSYFNFPVLFHLIVRQS